MTRKPTRKPTSRTRQTPRTARTVRRRRANRAGRVWLRLARMVRLLLTGSAPSTRTVTPRSARAGRDGARTRPGAVEGAAYCGACDTAPCENPTEHQVALTPLAAYVRSGAWKGLKDTGEPA